MKSCIRILLLTTALCVAGINTALADSVYIGSLEKTSAVKAFDGEFDIIKEPETNAVAVTKDGYIIISPGATDKMTVSVDGAENNISIVAASVYDFEEEKSAEDFIQFSDNRKEYEEGGYYSDGGEMNVSALELSKDNLRLSFKFMKPDTETADIIKLSDSGNTIAQISFNKRNDSLVYLSYLDGEKTVKLRNQTYNIGEWFIADVYINLAEGNMKLLINGIEAVIAPVNEHGFVNEISFCTYVDDISLLSGFVVEEGGIEIGLEEQTVPVDGISLTDPMVRIKLNDEMHGINAKYVSFNTEGTGIMPSDGMIVTNGECDVKISCGAVISGIEYKAEKTVTFNAVNAEGTAPLGLVVFEPVFENDKVKLRVMNGEGMNLKAIVCRSLADGAMEYIFNDWIPEAADSDTELEAEGECTVYLIDTAGKTDLLAKEGV